MRGPRNHIGDDPKFFLINETLNYKSGQGSTLNAYNQVYHYGLGCRFSLGFAQYSIDQISGTSDAIGCKFSKFSSKGPEPHPTPVLCIRTPHASNYCTSRYWRYAKLHTLQHSLKMEIVVDFRSCISLCCWGKVFLLSTTQSTHIPYNLPS